MSRRRPSEDDLCAGCEHPRWHHAGNSQDDEYTGSTICHHEEGETGRRKRCPCPRFQEPARRIKTRRPRPRTQDGRYEAQPK